MTNFQEHTDSKIYFLHGFAEIIILDEDTINFVQLSLILNCRTEPLMIKIISGNIFTAVRVCFNVSWNYFKVDCIYCKSLSENLPKRDC